MDCDLKNHTKQVIMLYRQFSMYTGDKMIFEFKPEEFFQDSGAYQQASAAAKNAGLPLVVYALKHLEVTFAEKGAAPTSMAPMPKVMPKAEVQTTNQKNEESNILEIKTNLKHDTLLESLDLSGYCMGPLKKNGYITVGDIVEFSKTHDLSEIPRFGEKTQTELREKLLMFNDEDEFEDDEDEDEFEDDLDDDDEYEDEDEYDDMKYDGLYAQAIALSEEEWSSESMKKILNIYKESWDIDDDTAKSQLGMIAKTNGFKTSDNSTYKQLILAIANNLKATNDQVKIIKNLSSELGEDFDKFTKTSRVQAQAGVDWGNMRFEDAKMMISEMRSELIEMKNMSSEPEPEMEEADIFDEDEDEFF